MIRILTAEEIQQHNLDKERIVNVVNTMPGVDYHQIAALLDMDFYRVVNLTNLLVEQGRIRAKLEVIDDGTF